MHTETKGVELLGHRVHQTLIVLPLGLLAGAALFDVVHIVNGSGDWARISFWLIAAGVVCALVAAVFGAIDWLGIPQGTRAKRVGAVHGIGNVVVAGLFGVSWLLRRDAPTDPSGLELVLSFGGVALALFTGWLGGELVSQLGVGVHGDAALDAPSSLDRGRLVARV
jgi:uncharacterized membrane protein